MSVSNVLFIYLKICRYDIILIRDMHLLCLACEQCFYCPLDCNKRYLISLVGCVFF